MAGSGDDGASAAKAKRGGRRVGAGRPKKTAEQKEADAAAKETAPAKRKYTRKQKEAKQAEVTDDKEANDSNDERPAKRQKNARFTPDGKYTMVSHPDEETDDTRRQIQEKVKIPNGNSDLKVYVIRPWPAADAR
jgi:hypothetical protein